MQRKTNRRTAGKEGTAAAIAALLLTGCLYGGSVAIVPVQQTAAAQYAYAKRYQESRQTDLIADESKYWGVRQIVIQTYEKVPEYFPDDRRFTPLAVLDVIILRCGFDSPRAKLEGGRLRRTMDRAIDDLTELARKYPEHEYVQAMSLYLQGNCYKQLGDFAEAQKCFKAVRDTYKTSANQDIKRLAGRAAILYNQVYTQE